MGQTLFYAAEGLESRKPRHVFVEDYEVERLLLNQFKSVMPVIRGGHVIATRAQEHQMGFQEVDFVVGPKYLRIIVHVSFSRRVDRLPRCRGHRQGEWKG